MKGRIVTAVVVAAGLAAVPAQAAPITRAAAVDRARDAIAAHPDAAHGGAGQTFAARDVVAGASGMTHVRFDRTYRGLDVLGGDLVVHVGAGGAFKGASLTMDRAPALSTTPSLSADRARQIAGGSASSPVRLVVDARRGAPRLAWEITVAGTQADGTPSLQTRTVDARSGDLLAVDEAVQTAGEGRSLYSGTVALSTSSANGSFVLSDPTRGNSRTGDTGNKTDRCVFSCTYAAAPLFTDADDVWGTGTTASRQSAAVDAHYGAAETWDYYAAVFGRRGIAGDGRGFASRVHYGRNYNNAFWDDACPCMSYGDGDGRAFNPLVSVDVAGHEMSHGVTSHEADLTYSGESGGLNEATSDIFGTMVEFYAGNAADPPDWTIGEEIVPAGKKPLRYMYRPSLDGGSADCWSSGVGNLDVHYSSGVGNHFFYLLSQGSAPTSTTPSGSPTCNGSAVTGIGNDAAQRIWYRALEGYMTSSTNYRGARTATLGAAAELYGAASAQYKAVAAAWSAVSVS